MSEWYPQLESRLNQDQPTWRYQVAVVTTELARRVAAALTGVDALNKSNFLSKDEAEKLYGARTTRAALQLSGSFPLNLSGLFGAGAHVIVDVWANLPNPAGQAIGDFFWATDRTVLYIVESVSGSNAWVYALGTMRGTIVVDQKPTLGTNDAGFLYYATDFDRSYRWDGSAWGDGPGEPARDYVEMFRTAPGGNGWHLCDGSAGVNISKTDGTVTSITVPTLNAATFLRGNAAYSGPAATLAVAPGLSGSTAAESTHTHALPLNTGNESSDVTVEGNATVTPTTVANAPHTHGIGGSTGAGSSHLHAKGTLAVDAAGLPQLMDFLPYIRL